MVKNKRLVLSKCLFGAGLLLNMAYATPLAVNDNVLMFFYIIGYLVMTGGLYANLQSKDPSFTKSRFYITAIALLLPFIGPLIAIGVMFVTREPDAPAPGWHTALFPPEKDRPSILKHALIAISLFFLDACVMNQGFISLLVLMIATVSGGIMLARLLFKKEKAVLKKRIVVAAIYAAAALLVVVANNQNNKLAKQRAQTVITACEAYKEKRGAYPAQLTDLVPDFMPEVPKTKMALSNNEFKYYVVGGEHELMFVALPPFGRPIYHFETKQWSYLD